MNEISTEYITHPLTHAGFECEIEYQKIKGLYRLIKIGVRIPSNNHFQWKECIFKNTSTESIERCFSFAKQQLDEFIGNNFNK